MATANRKLRRSLSAIDDQKTLERKRDRYEAWYAAQPGSTRRGIARGTFVFSAEIAQLRTDLGIA